MKSQHELGETAQLVVLQRVDGAVLILEEFDGRWNLPGGRLNKGEAWLAGLQREVKEETGIQKFELTGMLNVYQRRSVRTNQPVYGVIFSGTTQESAVTVSHEHRSYQWVSSLEQCVGKIFYPQQIEEAVRAVLTRKDLWRS